MTKKIIAMLLCMTIVSGLLCSCGKTNNNKDNTKDDNQESITSIEEEEDSKVPYKKDGNWWIGDVDTGIKAATEDGDDGVSIVDSYVDSNQHLWYEFSDGNKIDAGYAGNTAGENASAETFTVTFLDQDGTELSVQTVEKRGEAAAPSVSDKDGYHFIGWDTEFDDVVSDIVVKPEYVQETDPLISVNKVTSSAGETDVEVIVSVKNNPGILGMTLSVSYDENVMELVDASNGDAFRDILNLTKSKELKSGCKFAWDGQEISQENIKDGSILILKFDISEDAQNGTYAIDFSNNGDCIDGNLNPIEIAVEDGSITIS